MTREDKDSLVELLAKIPVKETKESLLGAIGKLLRVIDISESSIMIPTLLKDKCEFDAYEMLTLAKILKASILGHNDLVEFYISESIHTDIGLRTSRSGSSTASPSTSSRSSTNGAGGSGGSGLLMSAHRHNNGHITNINNNTLVSGSNKSSQLQLGQNGEPDATVRLLLQIEQLKVFIPHVTGIFESIIELYKNSVDTNT